MERGRLVVTGASGLIGRRLCQHLSSNGWSLVRLVRSTPQGPDEAQWDPSRGTVDPLALEGCYGVVHLAGEPVSGRWTPEKKARIRDSRVKGTATLARAIGQLANAPSVWVSCSAVGYYGDRGDEVVEEGADPGNDFLAEVCVAWEQQADPVRAITRVVHPRIGLVLSTEGGALAEMLPPFKLGLGGRIGSGNQYMSWIGLHDVVRGLEHCLVTDALHGPVNFTAPEPATNAQFTKALGKALHRPTLFPVPTFALRARFGEFAASIVAGQRAVPRALLDSGFRFSSADLDEALARTLAVSY